jgi:hypothetical protein
MSALAAHFYALIGMLTGPAAALHPEASRWQAWV